jgi:hypothetical protein
MISSFPCSTVIRGTNLAYGTRTEEDREGRFTQAAFDSLHLGFSRKISGETGKRMPGVYVDTLSLLIFDFLSSLCEKNFGLV